MFGAAGEAGRKVVQCLPNDQAIRSLPDDTAPFLDSKHPDLYQTHSHLRHK